MEQQAEMVAAAEAVRSWVVAQRATWGGTSPLPPPVVVDTPLPAFDTLPPAFAIEPPVFAVDQPPTALSFDDGMEATVEEPAVPSLAPFLRLPEPVTSVYVEAPRRLLSVRLLARAAVALVACGLVATGGYAGWKHYSTAPRTGTAVVGSAPDGAEVLVDGAAAGTAPLRLELPAGSHQIEMRLKGRTRTEQITIARGGETPVTIDFNGRPTGGLQVTSTPVGARVVVDGHERGVTPLELSGISAGAHVVQIESPEGTVKRSVQITSGRTEVLTEAIYPGWIHVSAPFDVVVVDGKTGVQLDTLNRALMKPGPHTLRIQNRSLGFVETRRIDVEPGDTTELDIATPTSTLTVTGPAGAEVLVDGERVGTVPLSGYRVKLGSREVTIVEPSGTTHHRSVTIISKPATIDLAAGQP
jgi:hypothetical protein